MGTMSKVAARNKKICSSFNFQISIVILPHPALPHQLAKKAVDSGLISSTRRLQPCKDIGIEPNRNSLLFGPIELAYDSVRWYFPNLRDIGKIDLTIRTGSKSLEFFPLFSR
jgi:hypothetical protein